MGVALNIYFDEHKGFCFFVAISLIFSCHLPQKITVAKKDKASISYVNPFTGADGQGHTYLGAKMPFGMMQFFSDTRLDGWNVCSSYHYWDDEIYGFSQTHLSGTGVSDYEDVLLIPTNN